MLTRIRKAQGSERAFTLIELIVVIIIIGILAAIAVAAYGQFVGQASDTAIKATAENIEDNALANAAFRQGTINDPRKVLADAPAAMATGSGTGALRKALDEVETDELQVFAFTGANPTPVAGNLVYNGKLARGMRSVGAVGTAPITFLGFVRGDQAGCIILSNKHNQNGQFVTGTSTARPAGCIAADAAQTPLP